MNVLLVDDHPLLRDALCAVMQSLAGEVMIHPAACAADAQAHLDTVPMDLAILDLHLPDANGLDLLRRWRSVHPAMPVVVLSASQNPWDMQQALSLGARGFVPKSKGGELLLNALRMVLAGGDYIPPEALAAYADPAGHRVHERAPAVAMQPVMHPAAHLPAHPPVQTTMVARAPAWLAPTTPPWPMGRSGVVHGRTDPPAPEHESLASVSASVSASALASTSLPAHRARLTRRQSEVLGLLMQGQSNKLIARQLCLSVETVKDHVASLLRALGVRSRTQAVVLMSRSAGTHEPQASDAPASPCQP